MHSVAICICLILLNNLTLETFGCSDGDKARHDYHIIDHYAVGDKARHQNDIDHDGDGEGHYDIHYDGHIKKISQCNKILTPEECAKATFKVEKKT
uniref:Uncharacterized protein n=1 Tax=Globodera rostochiensis TaxID=31243 RepID=A0A914I1N3_GLORO